jgi:acyl-CoA thioesterase-1
MKNILFFGDSLTAGYGLRNPAAESFPALIGHKINALNLNYKITNAGLSGDTSAGGLQRLDYWISTPIDIFVLELGINDVIRGVSPQITLHNLQSITDRIKTKHPGVKIALMGMLIPSFIPSPFASQFNAVYPALADKNKIEFVPFFLEGVAGRTHLNLPDRLHPSAEGYQVIAENVWPFIQKLIIN